MASGSYLMPSSSNSNSLQAPGQSTSQSYCMSATSKKSKPSAAEAPTTQMPSLDSVSSKTTAFQHVLPDSSSTTTHSDAGAVKGSSLRALNSFMAYRVYYNPIFHSFEQKERSGFMKTMWAEEESKAKWSIIAKAWSIIRDEVGKDSAPLDRFLQLACPYIDILSRDTYLSTLGWQLDPNNGNNSLRRNFIPNFDAFPASFRTTIKSVQDVIDFVRSSGYAIPPKEIPIFSKSTSTSHLMLAAQPVHHFITAARSTFLPSSIFNSANHSGGNTNAQLPSTSSFRGQLPSSFLVASSHSAAQTASMTTTTALPRAGSSTHTGAEESGQDDAMDIDSNQPPSQQQTNIVTTAQGIQKVSAGGDSGSAQGNISDAQSNHQAIMTATQQHNAAADGSNRGDGGAPLTGGSMTHEQMMNYMHGVDIEPVESGTYSSHTDDFIMNPDPRSCVMSRTSFTDPDRLAFSLNMGNPDEILSYCPASMRLSANTMAVSVMRPTPEEDAQAAWVDCALQLMDTSTTFPYAEFFSPEHEGLNVFDIEGIPAFTAVDCADF